MSSIIYLTRISLWCSVVHLWPHTYPLIYWIDCCILYNIICCLMSSVMLYIIFLTPSYCLIPLINVSVLFVTSLLYRRIPSIVVFMESRDPCIISMYPSHIVLSIKSSYPRIYIVLASRSGVSLILSNKSRRINIIVGLIFKIDCCVWIMTPVSIELADTNTTTMTESTTKMVEVETHRISKIERQDKAKRDERRWEEWELDRQRQFVCMIINCISDTNISNGNYALRIHYALLMHHLCT